MSSPSETLYHPINGTTEKTWEGFSWPGFFFGVIWLAIKQLWVHFIVSIIIIIITAGFGAIPVWIFYGFTGNSFHRKLLLSKGYLTKEQFSQKTERDKKSSISENKFTNTSVADELAKLAELRNSGILTEEEFLQRKRKLLD
jgi:hypothetical protein